MNITADSILGFIEGQVESKKMLNPDLWLDAAAKLNVLRGKETDRLTDMRRKVAEVKLGYLEKQEKKNVSEAELRVEASEEYANMKKQEYKCERIEEFIRIAKLNARSMGNF